jgi:tetraacyldisaccharide 4'-kinase
MRKPLTASAWARVAERLVEPAVLLHDRLHASGLLPAFHAALPVISIGNLTVGGTGKTPCVIWLVKELVSRGERVVVLSRGYGRRGRGTLILGADGAPPPDADQAGDEPVEIFEATGVPVIVGRDRRRSARIAFENCRATCLVLDDGFQHRPLHRDFDIVLLDARSPLGNGHLLPAGPLREPPSALRRADLVILTRAASAGDPEAARRKVAALCAPPAGIALADHVVVGLQPLAGGATESSPSPGPVFLTSGIADPTAFEESAASAGLKTAGARHFPDHHRYSADDFELVHRAAAGRPVVTTAKDSVRWGKAPGFDAGGWWVLRIEFRPRDGAALLSRIDQVLRNAGRSPGASGAT